MSNALLDALDVTKRQIKFVSLGAAGAAWAAASVLLLLGFVLWDHWATGGVPTWAATGLRIFYLAGTVVWLVGGVVIPGLRHISDVYAARVIERQHSGFRNALVGAVQLARREELPGSVRVAIVQQASREAKQTDVRRVVSRTALRRMGIVCAAVLVSFIGYWFVAPKSVVVSVRRAFGAHLPPPTRTLVQEVEPAGGLRVLRGKDVVFRVKLGGEQPREAWVRFSLDGGQTWPAAQRMKLARLSRDGNWVGTRSGADVQASCQWQVLAGDARSDLRPLIVLPEPAVVDVQVHYEYPHYTGLAPATQPGGDIDAMVGTKVLITAHTNVPARRPVLVSGEGLAEQRRVLPELNGETRTLSADWTVNQDGVYHLQFADEEGHVNGVTNYQIHARPDRAPIADWEGDGNGLEVDRDESVSIAARANDDFGVSRAVLGYRRALDQSTGESPLKIQATGNGEYKLRGSVSPTDLGLKVGDSAEIWITVWDNREDAAGQPKAQRGDSSMRRLTVRRPTATSPSLARKEEKPSSQPSGTARQEETPHKQIESKKTEMARNDQPDYQLQQFLNQHDKELAQIEHKLNQEMRNEPGGREKGSVPNVIPDEKKNGSASAPSDGGSGDAKKADGDGQMGDPSKGSAKPDQGEKKPGANEKSASGEEQASGQKNEGAAGDKGKNPQDSDGKQGDGDQKHSDNSSDSRADGASQQAKDGGKTDKSDQGQENKDRKENQASAHATSQPDGSAQNADANGPRNTDEPSKAAGGQTPGNPGENDPKETKSDSSETNPNGAPDSSNASKNNGRGGDKEKQPSGDKKTPSPEEKSETGDGQQRSTKLNPDNSEKKDAEQTSSQPSDGSGNTPSGEKTPQSQNADSGQSPDDHDESATGQKSKAQGNNEDSNEKSPTAGDQGKRQTAPISAESKKDSQSPEGSQSGEKKDGSNESNGSKSQQNKSNEQQSGEKKGSSADQKSESGENKDVSKKNSPAESEKAQGQKPDASKEETEQPKDSQSDEKKDGSKESSEQKEQKSKSSEQQSGDKKESSADQKSNSAEGKSESKENSSAGSEKEQKQKSDPFQEQSEKTQDSQSNEKKSDSKEGSESKETKKDGGSESKGSSSEGGNKPAESKSDSPSDPANSPGEKSGEGKSQGQPGNSGEGSGDKKSASGNGETPGGDQPSLKGQPSKGSEGQPTQSGDGPKAGASQSPGSESGEKKGKEPGNKESSEESKGELGQVGNGSPLVGRGGREGGVSNSISQATQPGQDVPAPETATGGPALQSNVDRADKLVDALERELRSGKENSQLLQDLGWDLPKAKQFVESYRRAQAKGQRQMLRSQLPTDRHSQTRPAGRESVVYGVTPASEGRAFHSDAPGSADQMQGAADPSRQRVPAKYRPLLEAYYRSVASQPGP